MSKIVDTTSIVAANDDLSAVDHLLAAYELTKDPFGKYLIGLALVHEGQKIAQDIPANISASIATGRG